jgi:hypothetical protein
VLLLNRRPPDAKTPRLIGFVDDVAQERSPNSDVDVFYDVLKREEFAKAPVWRGVEMRGWSGRVGYFEAARTERGGDYGPTVFVAANEFWDFVLSDEPLILDDREFDISIFVVGVVSAAR